MKDTLKAKDWNNTETEFERGDRVLFHDDDGRLFYGTVGQCSDRSMQISFDDGDIGWEAPEMCEVVREDNSAKTHGLVLLSLSRGQYVKNMLGNDISFCGDAEPVDEAVEFGALYTAKELNDLAESLGRDFEVQPADLLQ